MRIRTLSIALALTLLAATSAFASPRVYSLDQCADQFVLALSPREAIVGLSKRANDRDSYLRAQAPGLPQGRATLEAALGARPQVVVRYWGGSPTLTAALERRGIKVVTIQEADDFPQVRANVRLVAAALGEEARGETLIAGMDAKLAAAAGAWNGRPALYLTSGGYTTGPGSLVDAMMRAAGLTNIVKKPSFAPVSLEAMVLSPPQAIVQGFFDRMGAQLQHWGLGRHRILQRVMNDRSIAVLPDSVLACPAWFAADGAQLLAQARR